MIKFDSDYLEGAHPNIIEALNKTNMLQSSGYGEDEFCNKAKDILKKKFKLDNSDIHFMIGGTSCNLTLISAALRPHQGVISANTGHINAHESGAVEATGHKVISIDSVDGKISLEDIKKIVFDHRNDEAKEHIVMPKMVYISNPTELGTIYKKDEIKQIYDFCKENGLYFYIDGARIGYALTCDENDLSMEILAQNCDAFYIGGTKVGALFGEALVISNPDLKEDFRYIQKQKGGMLAKGRLLGIQFIELFKDNLYFQISKNANECAKIIKDACIKKGYKFLCESPTNQQFPIISDQELKILSSKYSYSLWKRIDRDHCAVRFCTGWATKIEDAKALADDILNLS